MSINCVVLLLLYIINSHNIDMCRSRLCIGLFDIAINCGIVRPYIIIMRFKKLPLILSMLLVTDLIFVMIDLVRMLHTVDMVV